MKDSSRTKAQLVDELVQLRQRLAELESSEKQRRKLEIALQDCQSRFRTVANFSYDWEYWRGLDGHYQYVSPACERITGFSPKEFLDDADFLNKIVHPDDREMLAQHLQAELQPEGRSHIDFRILNRDGEERWIEHICQPVHTETGEWLGRRASNRDATTTMKAEAETCRQRSVLSAINRIFREALLGETEKDLALTCLNVAQDLTNSQFGFVGEVNPAGRMDTLVLSDPGWEACRVPKSDAVTLITDLELRGFWGRVINDETPLIVNDPTSHPDHVGVPEGHPPITCFMGVPLKDDGNTFGIVALANKDGGYTHNDQLAIEDLSIAIVETIKRKRMEITLDQQAQEILDISTPVLEVWPGAVVAPLIGTLDSQRTQRFTEILLERLVDTHAEVLLIDITAVPTVDT